MTALSTAETIALSPADPVSLAPLRRAQRQWPTWVAAILTALLVVGFARELLSGGFDALRVSVPTSAAFYLSFVLAYAAQPVSDFIIFRRLWGLPAAGIVPVLRKLVANEVLFGYSGEAYFYAWARARLKFVAAPFAAVKDVSILSAIVGNLITLGLLGAAVPSLDALLPSELTKPVVWSAALIIAISLAVLLAGRRVFSLRAEELAFVFGVHGARAAAYTLFLALSWHLAMPTAPLALWLLLVASRQVVARLPLVPNKDILFANLAGLMVGGHKDVTSLIASSVALTLVLHLLAYLATLAPSVFKRQAP